MNEIGVIQTMLPSMKKANIVWIREGKSKKYHTHTHPDKEKGGEVKLEGGGAYRGKTIY